MRDLIAAMAVWTLISLVVAGALTGIYSWDYAQNCADLGGVFAVDGADLTCTHPHYASGE